MTKTTAICVYGAREHNLRNVNAVFPRGRITVVTGLSGSGKSSLAFDTVFAEGQRRYVESLSSYARQFLAQLQKPQVDRIEGLSPTIAIQQRVSTAGPRSTVATSTEIYDYLRVLFARTATPHCWTCHEPISRQDVSTIVDEAMAFPARTRLMILAPLVHRKRGKHDELLASILKRGFIRVRVDGKVVMVEDLPPLAPQSSHTIEAVIDRVTVKSDAGQRMADSVETAVTLSHGRVIVAVDRGDGNWTDHAYSTVLSCTSHPDIVVAETTPQLLSFNSPAGACESCHGLGTTMDFEPDLLIPDPRISLNNGALSTALPLRWRKALVESINLACHRLNVDPDVAFGNLPESAHDTLLHGEHESTGSTSFSGIIPWLRQKFEQTDSEKTTQALQDFRSESPCPSCQGARLNETARSLKIDTRSIADVTAMTVTDCQTWIASLSLDKKHRQVAEPLVEGISKRLRFLDEVGVAYLTLDRSARSLSGGEWQRMRLATQIGGALAGVCYVLDEPTVGLHARDAQRLADILLSLAELDNTVIVVEHEEEIIRAASHIIDVGPGAGAEGGDIVAAGTLKDVLESGRSVTAGYLTGKLVIPLPRQRRKPDWKFAVELKGARANNLKNLDVRIPLGRFVCVTGVSGSGKSSLINQVLLRVLRRKLNQRGARPGEFKRIVGSHHINKVVEVDQAPIGRSPRSTPATYVGALDQVRNLYAKTRESKVRGYTPARFSFNVKGGRCEQCEGQGVTRVSMHFLPDMFVLCEACQGRRYNRETLEVRYRGKTIADILDMSVTEAVTFFDNIASIKNRIAPLKEVGLGYIKLGQSSATLSGGEAQRIKLAAELQKAADGHTLYILDEPTTGLHFADVRNLLGVLRRLVERDQTVLVIEHHLDVIKVADWVIDLGPEGGDAGGYIVAEGTPEEIAAHEGSHTGRFLGRVMSRNICP